MSYSKKQIYERAKELVREHKLILMKDIIAMIGISKDTFYRLIPNESDKSDELKRMLLENKAAIKVYLRKKWSESDNPTLQIALYKLCADPEELKLLQQTYVDHTSKDEQIRIAALFPTQDEINEALEDNGGGNEQSTS